MWTRNLREGQKWISGVIVDRLGPLSYLIHLPNGELWRRHIDHLRGSSNEPTTSCQEGSTIVPPTVDSSDDFISLPTLHDPEMQQVPDAELPPQSVTETSSSMTQDSRPVSGSQSK